MFGRFAVVHRRGAVLSPAPQVMVELVAERLKDVGSAARAAGRRRLPR
jgi:hypothetical protein